MATWRVEAPCEGVEIYYVEADTKAEAEEFFVERGEFERFDFRTFTEKPEAEEIE